MKIGDRVDGRYSIESLIGRGGLEPSGRRWTGKIGKLLLSRSSGTNG